MGFSERLEAKRLEADGRGDAEGLRALALRGFVLSTLRAVRDLERNDDYQALFGYETIDLAASPEPGVAFLRGSEDGRYGNHAVRIGIRCGMATAAEFQVTHLVRTSAEGAWFRNGGSAFLAVDPDDVAEKLWDAVAAYMVENAPDHVSGMTVGRAA